MVHFLVIFELIYWRKKNVINIKPIQRRAIDIVKIIEVFKLKIEFFSTLFGLLLMILKLN